MTNEEMHVLREQLIKFGFHAPDMTVTEFIEDCFPSALRKQCASGCQADAKSVPSGCQVDGDCISREMAIKALKNEEPDWESESYCQWEDDMKAIEKLPSIEPKRTGKWIRWMETIETKSCTDYIPHCKCSECGTEYDPHSAQFVKFCNECGARMVGDSDNR